MLYTKDAGYGKFFYYCTVHFHSLFEADPNFTLQVPELPKDRKARCIWFHFEKTTSGL